MPAQYVMQGDTASKDAAYRPRGACIDLLYSHDPAVCIVGPAQTGKTLATCFKIHTLCCKYPKASILICRKTARSLVGSILKTFARVIDGAPVEIIGGEHPERYVYANGSTVWVAGLDKADRILSSEYDLVLVNQADDGISLNDYEVLRTRCTGRSAVIPFPQIILDMNPSGSRHWVLQLEKDKKVRLLWSRFSDNPTLMDEQGNLTPLGTRTMSILSSLTGMRRARLYEGKFATPEGAVYENFNASIHAKERDPREMVHWYLAMDEGFTNPQTNLLVGSDTDGRWHIFREFYVTRHLESEIVKQANGWYDDVRSAGLLLPVSKGCELVAVDEAAAGLIAALKAAGMKAVGGKGEVLDGIKKIQDRLKVQNDGKPRLTVDPSCVNTINEFESYIWKPEKDVPVDKDNHAIGGLRYLQDVLSEPTGAIDAKALAGIRLPKPEIRWDKPLRF